MKMCDIREFINYWVLQFINCWATKLKICWLSEWGVETNEMNEDRLDGGVWWEYKSGIWILINLFLKLWWIQAFPRAFNIFNNTHVLFISAWPQTPKLSFALSSIFISIYFSFPEILSLLLFFSLYSISLHCLLHCGTLSCICKFKWKSYDNGCRPENKKKGLQHIVWHSMDWYWAGVWAYQKWLNLV